MNLEQLIPQYGEHDAELKELKKVCDSEKDEIKRIMLKEGLASESYGGYKVTNTVSVRESFDEERALDILKASGVTSVIKTKEYLDMDALENEIYAGNISKDVILLLDKCRTETEVVTLKCNKVKK